MYQCKKVIRFRHVHTYQPPGIVTQALSPCPDPKFKEYQFLHQGMYSTVVYDDVLSHLYKNNAQTDGEGGGEAALSVPDNNFQMMRRGGLGLQRDGRRRLDTSTV
jgi:hypothetical protein